MSKILFLLLTAAAATLAQPAQVGGGTPVLPQCTATRLTNCTPRVDRDGILAAPSVLLRSYKIAELPATAPMNQVTVVVDAADCADPLTPGGTKACLVRWNGVAWVIFGGGGGGVSGTFTPRGLWASGTSYAALDLVSYDGIAYASVADDNVGHQPDTSPTWWATTGPPGPTGDAGADGEEVELQVTATHIQWRVGEGAWQNLVALADLKGEAGEAGSPGVPGVDGADGREVELQTTTTHIQWRYIGEVTWTDLVALSDLKGDDGGPGADGREVEFQKTATHIQWRYVGDSTWNNLVPLSDLKGDPGPSGIPNASDLLASGTQLTVTHDGGLTDPYALTFSCVDEDDGRKVEPSGVIATADDVTFSFASTETNVRCTVSLAGASLPPQLWKRSGGALSPWRAGDSVAMGATLPDGAPANSVAVGGNLYVPPLGGSSLFVDAENGSDANSGASPSDAWATVAKADTATLSAGQVVGLKSYSAPAAILGHDDVFAAQDTWALMRRGPWTNYLLDAGTLFDACEADWVKALGGETAVVEPNNAEYYRSGTGGLKITSDGTTTRADKTIEANFADAGVISFWVYVPAASQPNISYLYLFLCADANCSTNLVRGITGASLHSGWNYVALSPGEFTQTGATWASAIIKIRFTLVVTGGTPEVFVDDIYTGIQRRPKIILTFDDGTASQYTEAFSYMQPRGLKGVVYVIRELTDTAGYLTRSQLQEMYDAGWDLGVHGEEVLTGLADLAAQKAEIASQRQFLLDNGWTRAANHYAYPGGQYDDDSLAALAQLGFLTARTTINRPQGNLIDERYQIARYGVGNYVLSTITEQVDIAVARGSSLWINIHRITASPSTQTEWSISNFRGLIDYLVEKRNAGVLDVVTVSEWYRGLYQ